MPINVNGYEVNPFEARQHQYDGIVGGDLILHLDAGIFINDSIGYSFRGQPTTNLTNNSRDFTGTSYGFYSEYNTPVLLRTYDSVINTPVGLGATLIQESGNYGFHLLNRWGGSGESGLHSLSCYIYPITDDITDFTIGLSGDNSNRIVFNLVSKTITYGSGISNRVAFIEEVSNFSGWYRVGANIEGRSGGWVGSIGYGTSQYTGVLGNKKLYITGVQYEYTERPTLFVEAQQTRGTTVDTGGGWPDISDNFNHVETPQNGPYFNRSNGGSLVFDGVDDYISKTGINYIPYCIDIWFYNNDQINPDQISGNNYQQLLGMGNYPGGVTLGGWTSQATNETISFFGSVWPTNGLSYIRDTIVVGWHNLIINWNGSFYDMWLDGSQKTVYAASSYGHCTLHSRDSIFIGKEDGTSSYEFNGNISSLRIYERSLSVQEIIQNYNVLKGRYVL